MSDTRAEMREFRFLEEKRTRGYLSPAEEARLNELRGVLGSQADPVQETNAVVDPAQQPQGYYGTDGQWYAYPADYTPSGDPNQGYDAAYAQQPQGYYGADGQWYAYPAQGEDPNQAYAQQPQGYYGADGQWYAYPTQGYDPHQPYAPQEQAYAPDYAEQSPAPAPQATPIYVPQPVQPVQDPVQITLESENLEIPALSAPAPWAEPEPEVTYPSAVPLEAAPSEAEDVFEVTDTDVTPVSEATPLPERLDEPESVDMSGWEDTPAQAEAPTAEPEYAAELESSDPIELGEDDFSSLNSDLATPSHRSAPPVNDVPLVPVRTLEVMPSDIERLQSAVEEEPPAGPAVVEYAEAEPEVVEFSEAEPEMMELSEAEPVLAEEPTTPVVDEWSSAPLAVENQESGTAATPAPTYEAGSDYGDPVTEPEPFSTDEESSDAALLEMDPMEVTASYAIPADPTGDVALLDPANALPAPGLGASTSMLSGSAADETPTLELSAIEAEPSTGAASATDMPWETSEDAMAYEASADVEPTPAFPSEEHVPSLELRPVQVAPDLQADTVEFTDSYDPKATQPFDETTSTADAMYDLSGDPNEPLPLASANEFLGHSEQSETSVSSEPVPLESSDSWSGEGGVSGESLPLESAAEFVSSPEFISASSTWGHQPETEEAASSEAQPEWSAPVEEQPVLEAEPEWASAEPAAPAEAQPEWSAPVEEQPVLEAQPEWSAPVEEQPVLEAEPEWASAEPAAPAEAQPEWSAPVEEQPVLEAQPEWSAPVEEQPVLEA
ncbi:MAG TPA: hypothetical protein VF794_37645, partial [Archangium sp.]